MRFEHLGRRLRRTAEDALVVSDVFGTVIPSQVITVFRSCARMLSGIGGTQLALPTSFPINVNHDKRVGLQLRSRCPLAAAIAVTIFVVVVVVPVPAVAIGRNVIIVVVLVVVTVTIQIKRRKLAAAIRWLPCCCAS
jgi:hypothetical protein